MTDRELAEIEARKDAADIANLVTEVRYLQVMLEEAQLALWRQQALLEFINRQNLGEMVH